MVLDFLKSIGTTAAQGAAGAFGKGLGGHAVTQLFRTPPHVIGERQKAYMDAAHPGTTPWEQLGTADMAGQLEGQARQERAAYATAGIGAAAQMAGQREESVTADIEAVERLVVSGQVTPEQALELVQKMRGREYPLEFGEDGSVMGAQARALREAEVEKARAEIGKLSQETQTELELQLTEAAKRVLLNRQAGLAQRQSSTEEEQWWKLFQENEMLEMERAFKARMLKAGLKAENAKTWWQSFEMFGQILRRDMESIEAKGYDSEALDTAFKVGITTMIANIALGAAGAAAKGAKAVKQALQKRGTKKRQRKVERGEFDKETGEIK